MARRIQVAALALVGCFGLSLLAGQEITPDPNRLQDLKVVIVGNGRTRSGHRTGFRIYEAEDGSRGQVTYAAFHYFPGPLELIEDWVNATPRVTSREKSQTKGKQIISDRVFGRAPSRDSEADEFVIIRRDDLNCYLIEAPTLQFALQIESTIGQK